MEEQVQAVTSFVDTIVDFAVSYGFQIAGALLILILGLRLARWGGGRVTRIAESRGIDPTLSRFIGNIIRFVVVVFVLIIAASNTCASVVVNHRIIFDEQHRYYE